MKHKLTPCLKYRTVLGVQFPSVDLLCFVKDLLIVKFGHIILLFIIEL